MAAGAKGAQRLVVLGATGFVGGAVAAEAIRRGLKVLCLSRKGVAPSYYASQEWARVAEWAAGDALQPETYRDKLDGADALVVSIGSPPLPFVDFGYQARGLVAAVICRTLHMGLSVECRPYVDSKMILNASSYSLTFPAQNTNIEASHKARQCIDHRS